MTGGRASFSTFARLTPTDTVLSYKTWKAASWICICAGSLDLDKSISKKKHLFPDAILRLGSLLIFLSPMWQIYSMQHCVGPKIVAKSQAH